MSTAPAAVSAGRASKSAPRPPAAVIARRWVARLTMPVLLLVGTESPAWAVRSVAAHGEAIPGSETRSLAGQGHSANMTAPDLLAAELERFFAAG